MMPNMNGYSVCEAIRADEATKHIPVIMLSAKTHLNAVEEGMRAGANLYLTKPIGFKTLIQSVHDILEENVTTAS